LSAVYFDSSALLTWLLDEPSAGEVAGRIAGAEWVVTSVLTLVEVERALARAVSGKVLREADAQRLRAVVARQRACWTVMTIGDEVLERAARPFPAEPLRTLDAIHLATALAFAKALPELKLITLDRRIAENAEALGLA
jgi:predicted nucleic acid-binding protein